MKKVITRTDFSGECRTCRTTFTYQYEDVVEYRDSDYTGSVDVYDVVTCPICETRIRHTVRF